MRERSQTTPRRRRNGPKQALPVESNYQLEQTEAIYGSTLLPSQRRFMDPWDLENYDYVRKKMDIDNILPDYETALDYELEPSQSPSPVYGHGNRLVMASTMPRPHTRRLSRSQCQLECCRLPNVNGSRNRSRSRKELLYAARSEVYGQAPISSRYDDYMATMTRQLHLDDDDIEQQEQEQRQIYNGYGGFSSASSTEPHSSISDELPLMTTLPRRAATLQRHAQPSETRDRTSYNNSNYSSGYGTAPHPRRKRSSATPTGKSLAMAQAKAMPQIDFPAPPPLSPAYDYCNPYATMPFCSLPDCAECQQQATSLIYAAPSTLYGRTGGTQSDSPSDSSLYAGIYSRKFGLSKKGLLQIDYSCSWNDLDRVMGRQY
ncbi:la-related protein 1 isoform X2 [Drosophila hydei]|nr:la-related protein 1 isoform X2 [Drosophila hydei]